MPQKPFPIVGIGASAGGVNALEGFFKGLPPDSGMAFVVVTHLNPERESYLHDIIGRYTPMQVVVAADGTRVEPNRVYVLPADAILSIEAGRLQIKKQNRGRPERKPVDIFLSSLAKDLGEYAVSVVLSGGDGDGTLGTKAVKERGGLTFAQIRDGYGPDQPSMPQSAISTGLIDFELPVGEMGLKLHEIAGSFDMQLEDMVASSEKKGEAALEDAKDEIYALLRDQIGHDFSGYKTKTFLRRVSRRMQIVHLNTIEGYVEKLRDDPAEANALFRDLLIKVTNFFRDAPAFEKLRELVIPKLFEGRGADDTVRVWVPGCATGEEVFSLAMLMREYMDELTATPRVQIFATDIDETALGVARAARYPEALLDTVSDERRKRFFIPDGGSYILCKEIRDLCIFSPHSVIRDPPFSRIDLVSCRNLLIYFGPKVQNQVIPIFHYSLRPGGYLFLGTSENVSQFSELFSPLDKKSRIFRSRDNGTQNARLPLLLGDPRLAGRNAAFKPGSSRAPGIGMRSSVETQVLARFAPAHVVANREGEIVHYSGRTGKYLEVPGGLPNRQIMAMARKGLRLDLRAAFREAVEKNDTVTRERIAVEADDGRVQMVALTVEPVWNANGAEPLFLILFIDQGPPLSREAALTNLEAPSEGDLAYVESELRDTRDRLQSMMEEYETALEELKSSNEELVSFNEEMQSTNEELEASKEEQQSLNEEMQTVNSELASKVEALDEAHNDLQNVFDSTQIATVFLDKALVLRTFTPAVTKIFNIQPSDRGRPITHFSSKLHLPALESDIRWVFSSGQIKERKIAGSNDHAHYLLRVIPYMSAEEKVEGVLLTFVDISNLTEAENQRVLIAELHHRTRNLIAVIQSIANQTVETSESLGSFKRHFNDRLAALARVQGLISTSRPESLSIGALVRLELEALNAPGDGKKAIAEGPEILLPEGIVRTLALALHELATNAAKHGALAVETGSLYITWTEVFVEDERRLELQWVETGVVIPPDKQNATHRGFGRKLIERALPYQLRARTHYELGSDGVRCSISLPLPAQGAGEGVPDV